MSFIGGGALANGMARALHRRGYFVREFVLRTVHKPAAGLKSLARQLGSRITSFDEARLDADVLWFAVPDDNIQEVARKISRERNFRGQVAFHSAGAFSSELIAPVGKAGASVGSLHPMMSFSTGNRTPELRGVTFAVEGDPSAVRCAKSIVKDLGGKSLTIRAADKALYHAFGAMIAPLLVAHLEAAERTARRAGLDARRARATMRPIVENVVAAFVAGGAEAAFSGPFKRGDVQTIERHLRALRGEEETVYRALARYAIEHIPTGNKQKLKKLL